MSAKERRLLDPALLPVSLWEPASQTLLLPPILAKAYETVIDRHNLRALTESRDPKNPPIGGLDKKKTDQHFAQAFDGSAARAQLAITDPKDEVMRASNAFMQTLSGNRVCIADAPCGAGAAALAFLSVIAELRSCQVLPRQPLDVRLIGAELSEPARAYASEIFEELQMFLESQAIFVEAEFIRWDILNKQDNATLNTRIAQSALPSDKRLLIVANFNGFLERKENRSKAEPQLEEIFRHASTDSAMVIWIEPQMNHATKDGGLFSGIARWVKEKWCRFAKVNSDGDFSKPFLLSESRFKSPLNPEKTHPVRLAVMRLDLARSS